ncbi:MAG: hypothetical protein WC564_01330 [Patescibacteria group bacterium]
MKSYLSKNQSIFLLVFILVFGSFIIASPAQAGWFGDAVAQLIGWIVYAFVYVIGLLIMLIMWVLIKIAQYNDFINASPVEYGWTIVRDVCNMFFILILLIIAFATILRVEKYSFKTLLPKLILMAVLINFSKLICGIFIDFTQVIMLTFVNGFKDIGTGNLTNMLGIDKIMSIDTSIQDDGSEITSWTIVGAYMLALMYSVIALMVLVTMVAVLAMRMIMIWVYVVLSPLAYLLSAFPAGEKYASQWWEEFSKNLIVGPILAFFIWLSFVSLGGVTSDPAHDPVAQISGIGKTVEEADTTGMIASSTAPSAAITEAGSPDHMIKFIISIAMLIGGLQIAQSLGGQAGGMAGKGMARMQKIGAGAAKSLGTGVKRVTGVERVQAAYKSYQDTKASERASRAKDDGLMISRAVGTVKKKLVAEPYMAAKNVLTQGAARKAEKARVELEEIKSSKTEDIDKLSQNKVRIDVERKAVNDDAAMNSVDKNQRLAELRAEESDLETKARTKGLDYSKLGDENYVKEEKDKAYAAGGFEQGDDVVKKKEEIAKHEKRQARNDKLRNIALTVAGITLAPVIPGHFLMELLHGKQASMPHISRSGDRDLNRVANYNAQKISAKKDELKYAGKEKLMDTIKTTSDHHEHAAATALALEKGYFTDSESAGVEKNKVHDRFKNDDRTDSVMNTAAEKNYVELSPPYSKLANAKKVLENSSSTPSQRSQAEKDRATANAEIASGLEDGSVKISDMSSTAIGLAIDAIASSMKDKSFQKQYDGASDSQKEAIKIALEGQIKTATDSGNDDGAYKAKAKLAYTESFNLDRFGASDANSADPAQVTNHNHKKKFLESMNDSEAAKAIKSKSSKKQFLQEIKVHLDSSGANINSGSTNEEIAKYLKDILPNAGLDTMDSVSKSIISAIKNYIVPTPPTPPTRNPRPQNNFT